MAKSSGGAGRAGRANITPFAYKRGESTFVARIRETHRGRQALRDIPAKGGIQLTTDFVKGARYARYAVADTPANRAAIRALGGTVSKL